MWITLIKAVIISSYLIRRVVKNPELDSNRRK